MVKHAAAQLALPLRTWGGARRGAGRPPKGARAGVSHLARGAHSAAHPVHVTLHVARGVPNLRGRAAFEAVRAAIVAGRERAGGRVVHFSVQATHVHLIVEARSRRALTALVQGLCIRVARGVNRAFEREGKVFSDRYHERPLTTPREVHRALSYVLCNFRKHAARARKGAVPLVGYMDGRSSARWFDGWKIPDAARRAIGLGRSTIGDCPVAAPRTWLLRTGYRRHGLIDPNHEPAPPKARRASPSERNDG